MHVLCHDVIPLSLQHIGRSSIGDCFEVAMNREKFPERVPFRLTRMLIKAMEVSGIEGSYRSTCERTMSVLRESRDSLVAMLEAFLYDPLISWRLVDLSRRSENVDGSLHLNVGFENENGAMDTDSGVPIDVGTRGNVLPISEGDEEKDDSDEDTNLLLSERVQSRLPSMPVRRSRDIAISATRARSLQMYSIVRVSPSTSMILVRKGPISWLFITKTKFPSSSP